MSSAYKFTTDRHFRLVDIDPQLEKFLSKKSLKGEALDEYITRDDLPQFLQYIVDVFKGVEVKRQPVHFIVDKSVYKILMDLKPVTNKRGVLTSIKGSFVLNDDITALFKDVQQTKNT